MYKIVTMCNNKVCRLCDEPRNIYVDIFKYHLKKEILELLAIEIHQNDSSVKICKSCFQKIKCWTEFRLKCQTINKEKYVKTEQLQNVNQSTEKENPLKQQGNKNVLVNSYEKRENERKEKSKSICDKMVLLKDTGSFCNKRKNITPQKKVKKLKTNILSVNIKRTETIANSNDDCPQLLPERPIRQKSTRTFVNIDCPVLEPIVLLDNEKHLKNQSSQNDMDSSSKFISLSCRKLNCHQSVKEILKKYMYLKLDRSLWNTNFKCRVVIPHINQMFNKAMREISFKAKNIEQRSNIEENHQNISIKKSEYENPKAQNGTKQHALTNLSSEILSLKPLCVENLIPDNKLQSDSLKFFQNKELEKYEQLTESIKQNVYNNSQLNEYEKTNFEHLEYSRPEKTNAREKFAPIQKQNTYSVFDTFQNSDFDNQSDCSFDMEQLYYSSDDNCENLNGKVFSSQENNKNLMKSSEIKNLLNTLKIEESSNESSNPQKKVTENSQYIKNQSEKNDIRDIQVRVLKINLPTTEKTFKLDFIKKYIEKNEKIAAKSTTLPCTLLQSDISNAERDHDYCYMSIQEKKLPSSTEVISTNNGKNNVEKSFSENKSHVNCLDYNEVIIGNSNNNIESSNMENYLESSMTSSNSINVNSSTKCNDSLSFEQIHPSTKVFHNLKKTLVTRDKNMKSKLPYMEKIGRKRVSLSLNNLDSVNSGDSLQSSTALISNTNMNSAYLEIDESRSVLIKTKKLNTGNSVYPNQKHLEDFEISTVNHTNDLISNIRKRYVLIRGLSPVSMTKPSNYQRSDLLIKNSRAESNQIDGFSRSHNFNNLTFTRFQSNEISEFQFSDNNSFQNINLILSDWSQNTLQYESDSTKTQIQQKNKCFDGNNFVENNNFESIAQHKLSLLKSEKTSNKLHILNNEPTDKALEHTDQTDGLQFNHTCQSKIVQGLDNSCYAFRNQEYEVQENNIALEETDQIVVSGMNNEQCDNVKTKVNDICKKGVNEVICKTKNKSGKQEVNELRLRVLSPETINKSFQ